VSQFACHILYVNNFGKGSSVSAQDGLVQSVNSSVRTRQIDLITMPYQKTDTGQCRKQ